MTEKYFSKSLYKSIHIHQYRKAEAGEIVSFAGLSEIDIGETIADKKLAKPLPIINIDELAEILNNL